MTRLAWTERPYEAGVDRGVFYAPGGTGVAWNGLTNVTESPSEVGSLSHHIDGVNVRRREKRGEMAGTIEAFTYPEELFEHTILGTRRRSFGLSYRVQTEDSYKIHLIYNILLAPSEKSHAYDETDPFSWPFTTTPLPVPEMKNSAHLTIDAKSAWPSALSAIETVLYGDESMDARLPSPTEVADIFDLNSILRIVDNGDGTWTATGPDELFTFNGDGTFEIDWTSVEYIDSETYKIRSW
jgi:hypothetical protein